MSDSAQEMWMLEDVERLLAKIGDQQNIMEWYYIRGVKQDWLSSYGQRDLTRDVIIGSYGRTFFKIWNTWM